MYKFLFIFLFVGCQTKEPVPPKPTPIVTDTNLCGEAQIKLEELKCIEKDKPFTKREKLSFEEFCKQTHQSGIYLNPKCLMSITTCEQIDSCTNSKE
jgi:hypothetical protein